MDTAASAAADRGGLRAAPSASARTTNDPARVTANVLIDVALERHRQVLRWGQQDHPSVDEAAADRVKRLRDAGYPDQHAGLPLARHHHVPTAPVARSLCESSAASGRLTWADIIVEEIAEAFEAAAFYGDGPELREEVVQVAAVAAAWLEALDRRAGT